MLDALNRAKRYRELAAGCRRLAAIGLSSETRVSWMAEHYGRLVKAEESAALQDPPGD